MNYDLNVRDMKTMVIGAGVTGVMVVERMSAGDWDMPGIPVVIVDDDPCKVGMHICGVPVAGDRNSIPALVRALGISQVVFAIPSATKASREAIYEICLSTGVRVVTLPPILGTPIDRVGRTPFRPIDVRDLLARDEVVLDTALVSSYIEGKTVLVTGGGGSIGSEICRQLMSARPSRIVIFDIYENTAYELLRELSQDHLDSRVDCIVEIGSIRDQGRLESLFRDYQPDVVFHAAAHKHVPLMERNPREAVLNNVLGTYRVANLADSFHCDRFLLISTDKAVNPTNVMGATKRMCEMIVQYFGCKSDTVFAAVRFGNVLGSHGSVIPLFQHQIEAGGPVTVTHPDITRYFMTIPEASRLVIQAGGMAKGGEIFILDMGEPVRISDLAEKLIRLSGYTPGEDIEIVYSGLRPGEKLYEELLMDTEQTIPTGFPDITVSVAAPLHADELLDNIEWLAEVAEKGSPQEIRQALMRAVPTYVASVAD